MIHVVNLINGEQIIGDMEIGFNDYKIINPFYIVDAMNEEGSVGSKLTNVLTFSSADYITIDKSKVIFDFPVSGAMSTYYKKLVKLHDKQLADQIVNEAIGEMDRAEKRFEKLMDMIKPDKSQLN